MGDETWDPDYPDYREWQGVITIEVPIAVRAMSGREKHTDPTEQGTWVAWALTQWMREKNEGADDLLTGEAKLVGHREERWTEWPTGA